MDKRQPTLADIFAYARTAKLHKLVGEKMTRALQARTRSARRFIFDEEASERVARVVQDIPELILRESQFARAPFDLTWIEYQAIPYWSLLNDQRQMEDHLDTRVGFLIDHNRVNVIAEGQDGGGPGVYPIAYHLNTEWPLADQLQFAETMQVSRLGIDLWMWGASADHFLNSGQTSLMRQLRDHNRADFICDPRYLKNSSALLKGAQGDMRTIIAFLLMLNRPSIVRYVHTLPNHRAWLKSRFVPFMSHTTVQVALDAAKTLKLIGTPQGEAIERRRHEVRGHYCHDQTARDYMRIAGCIHEWEPTAGPEDDWQRCATLEEVNHWVCAACGGKRWWRSAYERGSAAIGFVNHDGYDVTNTGGEHGKLE